MPLVTMPDGTNVQMPDKLSPDQFKQMESLQSSGRRMSSGPSGRRISPTGGKDYPQIPFTQRAVLAAMDNPDEQKAYLEKQYGKGSIRKDKKGLIVVQGGKKMRAGTGVLAELVASAPELTLGTAGAVAGSELGPPGAIAGAFAGGAAGKSIKEAIKSATGLQKKDPMGIVRSVGVAGADVAAGEGAGKVLGLARKMPLRTMAFGTTQETRGMTDRLLKAGARPPPQSTMPDARRIQRISILADKISGPNKSIDRVNIGYLQERIAGILDKAGVPKGKARDDTLQRLTNTESAMEFQQTGQLVQQGARTVLQNYPKGSKSKIVAYLRNIAAPGRTPEDAYHYLVQPGQADILERVFNAFGKNSVQVQAVQQRALREVLSGAMERTASTWDLGVLDLIGGGTSAGAASVKPGSGMAIGTLEEALKQFTPKQKELLFPGGTLNDLRLVSKEIQFLYPKISDPGMAGMTAGAILQRPLLGGGGGSLAHGKSYADVLHSRLAAQMYYSMMRAFLQTPTMIRRLAIGLRNTKTRAVTRTALKSMMSFGALEMQNPGKNPDEGFSQQRGEHDTLSRTITAGGAPPQ